MKTFLKSAFATMSVIVLSQTTVCAENGSNSNSALSYSAVAGFVALIIFVVVAPAFKGVHNRLNSIKK